MELKKGNIFTTKCKTIVNTINCVGVMGAGIAYEFRLRYPEMYHKYKEYVLNNKIKIGILWLYKLKDRWILNFPTKFHWKYPSKDKYLRQGLETFVEKYRENGIKSIAFPLLGASNGGISKKKSREIMEYYLKKIDGDIKIEIWDFDRNEKDDLYDELKSLFRKKVEQILEEIRELDNKKTGISKSSIEIIKTELESKNIKRLIELSNVRGIGYKTLEKIFRYVMNKKYNKKNLEYEEDIFLKID
ncbi:hypothetical protein JCM12298_05360 [Desulfothermus naphthae]